MPASLSPLHLLTLVVLWAACSVSEVQAEGRAVKLCGREFIRAVVYTCGGSRWRRLLTPQDLQGGKSSGAVGLHERAASALSTRDLNNMCCQTGCLKSDLALLC